jgi:hypothetical protein
VPAQFQRTHMGINRLRRTRVQWAGAHLITRWRIVAITAHPGRRVLFHWIVAPMRTSWPRRYDRRLAPPSTTTRGNDVPAHTSMAGGLGSSGFQEL